MRVLETGAWYAVMLQPLETSLSRKRHENPLGTTCQQVLIWDEAPLLSRCFDLSPPVGFDRRWSLWDPAPLAGLGRKPIASRRARTRDAWEVEPQEAPAELSAVTL